MPVSIIIPTLNEEHYLPFLLDSLQRVTTPLDIIVVDGDSTDNTREVVTKYIDTFSEHSSLRLLRSPKRRISIQRNFGALHAKHDVYVFCDADVIVPSHEMWLKALAEFVHCNYAVAGPKAEPSESRLDFTIVYSIGMGVQKMLHWFNRPFFGGFFLMTKRDVFITCGGFDENIHLGEDVDYSVRASKHGGYGVVNATIYVSARRALKYGYMWLLKDFRILIQFFRTYEVDHSLSYPFGDYKEVHTSLKNKARN